MSSLPPLPGIGLFGRLSLELREKIWTHFRVGFDNPKMSQLSIDDQNNKNPRPAIMARIQRVWQSTELKRMIEIAELQGMSVEQRRDFRSQEHKRKKLAIMRTCRHIYMEVSDVLYRNESLSFTIAPLFGYYIMNSRNIYWESRNLFDQYSIIFRCLPYHRLSEITIRIEAIDDREDPGQLYRSWHFAGLLARILGRSSSLPNIHVIFNDTGEADWCKLDSKPKHPKPKSSIQQYRHSEFEDVALSDFIVILSQLQKLLPSYPQGLLTLVMTGERSRACFMAAYRRWLEILMRDKDILDRIYLDLEDTLDFLPGTTADRARLDRFRDWHDRGQWPYLQKWEALIERHPLWPTKWIFKISERQQRFFELYNPSSGRMKKMRMMCRIHWSHGFNTRFLSLDYKFQLEKVVEHWFPDGRAGANHLFLQAEQQLHYIKGNWPSSEDWDYHDISGIGRLDTSEWRVEAIMPFMNSNGIPNQYWLDYVARHRARHATQANNANK